MLVSAKPDADFSRGCAVGESASYFSRPTPTAIRELTLGDTSVMRELLLFLLALWSCLWLQPQGDVGWLNRLSVHQPIVESLLHRFSVVIPPFSVKRNAHLSVRRRQLRSHLWIYFGDRFFVYRCIWDEFGEPIVVLSGYAGGDEPHRLLFIGCSFRNY